MITKPLLLEDRFEIMPMLNLIRDKVTSKELRLEARLMKLLCLLMQHEGQLVSREYITKEIWDDYGNADEGLTQGISYLRKVLADEQKKLIETIPKKGYVLRAKLSELTSQGAGLTVGNSTLTPRTKRRTLLLRVGVIGLVLILVLLFLKSKEGAQTGPDVSPALEDVNTNLDHIPSSGSRGADVLNWDSVNNRHIDSLKTKEK